MVYKSRQHDQPTRFVDRAGNRGLLTRRGATMGRRRRHASAADSHAQSYLAQGSFEDPLPTPPKLRAGGALHPGQRTDTRGQFWLFDATGLEPSRPYELHLTGAGGKRLCDPWMLKTFPAPSEHPKRLRLLIYSGAGGHDALKQPDGRCWFLPSTVRARMLERALSFAPDALIANGDHVYWDLLAPRASLNLGASPKAIA
jgi:hypothetical protein